MDDLELLDAEVFKVLDASWKPFGPEGKMCSFALNWDAIVIAKDINEDSELLKLYDPEEYVGTVRSWQDINKPRPDDYREIKYKDSNRSCWKLEFWKAEVINKESEIGLEHDEHLWVYRISQVKHGEINDWHVSHESKIVISGDTPDVSCFMLDYVHFINKLAFGFASCNNTK